MEKQAVIYLRDKYKAQKLPLEIICDNMIRFYDNIDDKSHVNLIWDDDNEILSEIRLVGDQYNLAIGPVMVASVQYSEIQFINQYLDKKSAIEYLQEHKDQIGEDEYNKGIKLMARAIDEIRDYHFV